MHTSETINELATALAKAQGAFLPAPRSMVNTFTGKSYATLADVLQVARESLASNGLSVTQAPEPTETLDFVVMTTRLLHSSGQWIENTVVLPVLNIGRNGAKLAPDAQSVMSAYTYARRAGLSAILGIAPDADDDGNAAAERQPAKAAAKEEVDLNAPALPDQRKAIRNICGQAMDADETAQNWYGVSVENLTFGQAGEMIQHLNREIGKQKAARG
jgi:hypothetical protein